MNDSLAWRQAQTLERDYWTSSAKALKNRATLLTDIAYYASMFAFAADEVGRRGLQSALEVGIGPYGIGSAVFLSDEITVKGVDPLARVSFHCDDAALDRYVRSFSERVNYEQVKGETLPFAANSYDLVASANVIDHCDRPVKVLQEMYRVLKPGGVFLLAVNSFSIIGRLKFETWRRLQRCKPVFVMHPFSFLHADLRSLVVDLGLKLLDEKAPKGRYLGNLGVSKFIAEKPLE